MLDEIRAAGGEVYAVTSEPQTLARNAQDDWETGLVHVGDPHQEIAGACAQRGWLSLFTADWGDEREGSAWIAADWVSHPKGYFQPGVLVLSREGRVLYRWRSRPSRQNIGGAIARPTPAYVWRRVRTAGEDGDTTDAPLDADPELDATPAPWPLFVMLLLANGWFLRPVPFEQRSEGSTPNQRIRVAALRLLGFAAAWVAAAFFLPTWLVALVFGAWLWKAVPAVREVNARFQNVGLANEPA
ncbi:MAG: hypothetical protein AAF430_19415 [Myxococcota bacterium]